MHTTAQTDAARIALDIEDQLRGAGDPARAEREKAYVKSDLRHFGASVPAIRKIAVAASVDHVAIASEDGSDRLLGSLGECR